jgi:hypothetical protein
VGKVGWFCGHLVILSNWDHMALLCRNTPSRRTRPCPQKPLPTVLTKPNYGREMAALIALDRIQNGESVDYEVI